MSRGSKWKVEQTKTKVVFRLQFHATHVPPTGWDKLFISFFSADTGKPTAKTSKANVRNGTCKWPDPIYETTRLHQNPQCKQYDDKLYKIIVAMGSSRSSILGETTINLADFVDPLKSSVVSLALQGCSYGTLLHVNVQILTSKTGFREFEQQRELRERVLDPGVNCHNQNATHKMCTLDEVTRRTRSKLDAAELSSVDEDTSVNEEYADSGIGFDGSSSTSGSLCTEKPESSSRHDIDGTRSTISGDALPHTIKGDAADLQNLLNGSTKSAELWTLENSTDCNSAAIFEENNRLRESLAVAESYSFSLKMEIGSLQCLADGLSAETEKFSHLLDAEISSLHDLTKEVSMLKSDYVNLKDDMSKLKDFTVGHTMKNDAQLGFDMIGQFQRGVTVVEVKIRELLSKIFHGHLDGDTKSICLELKALLNFVLDLKLENRVTSETFGTNEIGKLVISNHEESSSGSLLGSDLCRPEILPHLILNTPESVLADSGVTLEAMNDQILDIVRELDEVKVEKGVLTKKMDQMECYYEGLVQELEDTQKRLLGELQLLRNERSTSLHALSAVEAENELLHQQINQQMQRFVEERRDLEELNKDLERRASISEAALRRARLNYTVAVDKLQKDLELLSSQVVSMFETNEGLIRKALPLQHERGMHNPEEDDKVEKLTSFNKKSVGGDILFEDLKRSFCLQGELYKKLEDELIRVYSMNLGLDIYSNALQGSLHDADILVGIMREKMEELEEELELSTASQNHLMLTLQQAKEDIHALNEFKANSISQCADLAEQNQLLEKKVMSISGENHILAQKLNDQENMAMECASYKNKCEAFLVENEELSLQLNHELLEKERLANDISALEENISSLKNECDKLLHLKENHEEKISNTEDKLSASLIQNAELSLQLKHGVLEKEKLVNDMSILEGQVVALTSESDKLLHLRESLEEKITFAENKLAACLAENAELSLQLKHELLEKEKLANDISVLEGNIATFKLESDKLLHLKQNHEENITLAENKLSACLIENADLSLQLKQEALEREKLANEMSTLHEEFVTLRLDSDKLLHLKESLEEKISFTEDKLAACLVENDQLSFQLKYEVLQNEKLANDISLLEGSTVTLKLECSKLLDLKENLEEKISFTEKKLAHLLELYNQQFYHLDVSPGSILENMDKKDVIFQLQQVQQDACLKNSQLLKENQVLKSERDSADASLMAFRSEIQVMKQLFEHNAQDMLMRLDLSNTLVAQFQVKLESLAEKLYLRSELENEYIEQIEKFLADLAHTEGQVGELFCENGYLSLAHSGMVALEQELQTSKQIIIELTDSNQELDWHLLNKTEESAKLSGDVSCLKEKMMSMLDDLHAEKHLRIELERRAMDLNSELNECHNKLVHQNDELEHARETVSDLEVEKSKLAHILSQQNEELGTQKSYQASLKGWLMELLDHAIATEVTQIYLANQYESHHLELNQKPCQSEVRQHAVEKKYSDGKIMLSQCEDSGASGGVETEFSLNGNPSAANLEDLRCRMRDAEEQIISFALLNEELEVVVMILEEKLKEASAELKKEYEDELTELRSRCNELSSKLSDQVMKTEEFKNLSIHLREIKDKAEAEYLVASRKTEVETPAVSGQDTLRVAFMKEQYETRNQELKQQLAISKKHGEEMLLKLQDAIDELENTKRSEALSLRRNEELCLRLANLDSELQSAITEKREKGKAYDRMKAELECALLSLECCKEERQKLEPCVLDIEVANSQLTLELSSMKQQLDELKSRAKLDNNYQVLETEMEQDASSVGGEDSFLETENVELHDFESVTCRGTHRTPETVATQPLAQSNGQDPNIVVEDSGVQRLKSCFEHLYEELERMKNENADESVDLDADKPGSTDPETELTLTQLTRANELLRSSFPLPDDISIGGNSLEKILSFEIELIEALNAKSSQNLQPQRDEEGIVKSFRDINELIKEFLQLKSRHASVEADLREMHQRYSQLSLRLAEVEGERQKLEMTLKTLRATRKIATLKRASTASNAGHL